MWLELDHHLFSRSGFTPGYACSCFRDFSEPSMSVLCMAALEREIREIEKDILKARGLEREALEYRLADRRSSLSRMIANFGIKKMSEGTSKFEEPE